MAKTNKIFDQYVELLEEKEKLDDRIIEMKKLVIAELKAMPENNYQTDIGKVVLVTKNNYEFKGEGAIQLKSLRERMELTLKPYNDKIKELTKEKKAEEKSFKSIEKELIDKLVAEEKDVANNNPTYTVRLNKI